jgi:hypothetical protein
VEHPCTQSRTMTRRASSRPSKASTCSFLPLPALPFLTLKYVYSDLSIQCTKSVCAGIFDQSCKDRWRQDLLPKRIRKRKSHSIPSQHPLTRPHQPFEEPNPSPVIQAKKTVLKTAKDTGLPFTALSTGGFPEYCFIPYAPVPIPLVIVCSVLLIANDVLCSPIGYNFAEKKVTVWGDGNAKASWTTIRSVAE